MDKCERPVIVEPFVKVNPAADTSINPSIKSEISNESEIKINPIIEPHATGIDVGLTADAMFTDIAASIAEVSLVANSKPKFDVNLDICKATLANDLLREITDEGAGAQATVSTKNLNEKISAVSTGVTKKSLAEVTKEVCM